MDLALIRELFVNCIAASALLKTDTAFATKLRGLVERLEPYRIGRHGQLQEWSRDFAESEPGHRHISHLYPLYPGDEFTPRRTPAWPRRSRPRCSVARTMAAHRPDGAGLGDLYLARMGDAARSGRSIDAFFKAARSTICSTRIPRTRGRSFRSTAISGSPPPSPRCCCKAMTARSRCCPPCPRHGATAASMACARAAA